MKLTTPAARAEKPRLVRAAFLLCLFLAVATTGSVWRVRFSPPLEGEWRWRVSFRTGEDRSSLGHVRLFS